MATMHWPRSIYELRELVSRGQHETEALWKEIREAVKFLASKRDDSTQQ